MSLEPHDVRMAAGAGAATLLEALDDEAVELMAHAAEALEPLLEHWRAQGLDAQQITTMLVGIAVAAGFDA